MLTARDILLGVIVPLVVSAVIVLLGRVVGGRREVGGALGVGVGFVVGCGLVFGWTRVPPGNAFEWVVPMGGVAAVVGTVAEVLRFRGGWVWGVAMVGLAWVLLGSQMGVGEMIGVAAVGWIWWGLWDWVVGREGRSDNAQRPTLNAQHSTGEERPARGAAKRSGWAGMVMVGVAGFASLVLMLSDSQKIGQMGLALVGACVGVWGVGWRLKSKVVWRGAGVAWGVILYGLLLDGKFWTEPGVTWGNGGLLLVAPLMAWVGEVPGVRGVTGWKRGAVRVLAVVVPVAVAVVMAVVEFQRAQQSSGSEYY